METSHRKAHMQYHQVCLESFGYTLPNEVVTSADLESRLQPLYERLRLPEGRLELMTGIRERRIWADGTVAQRQEHRKRREGDCGVWN